MRSGHFSADVGQGDLPAPGTANGHSPENIYIDDIARRICAGFRVPDVRANTLYEGEYLLGTSIARPLIAKRLIEIAAGSQAISHRRLRQGQRPGAFRIRSMR